MPQRIREVMTPDPKVLPKTASVKEAAELMRDDDIGDVIVVNAHKKVYGILTDRDIAVRVVPEGSDPSSVTLEDVATKDVASLGPEALVEEAVRLMREKAIRRLPIVEDGKPVGVVSLGDLAIEKDPTSALADISAAPPDEPEPSANGSGMRGAATDLGKTLPALAVGAGLALTVDYLRNRGKKRSVKVAAKRLRRTGRKLRRSGDRAASEATTQAAKYAAAAAAVIRSQGKRMKNKAEDAGEETRDRAEAVGRKAERRSGKLGKRAERSSKDFADFAEDKSKDLKRRAKDLGKKAERKADDAKEMVGAGKR
ncbi:MAG TPA: CBS domain-containing protein [Actinomycetota bacterium]|nr:CBS domain-containing protein [Actinomycetota bacterium]